MKDITRAAVLKAIRKIVCTEGNIKTGISDNIPMSACPASVIARLGAIATEINRVYGTSLTGNGIFRMTISDIVDCIMRRFPKSETNSNPRSSDHSNCGSSKRCLNIVVVGRSGVGKSSFLNYAAGKNVFETGKGDPVTQKYFEQIDIEKPEKNVVYSLFDTKGLEAGNTEEWKTAIYDEIARRDESDNIYDWFHTIIYCIDASSKRIQPFEVNAICELAERGSVLVLLTKKDLVTPEILEDLRKQILQEIGDRVQVLSVCSVSVRTRKGESKANGLEDVLRVSFLGLWEKASKILPRKTIGDHVIVNRTLYVDFDLPDLVAYAALGTAVFDENGGTEFPAAYNFCDVLGCEYSDLDDLYDRESVPFSYFKKIEKESEIEVKDSGFHVAVVIDHCFWNILCPSETIDHEELDSGYYRSAIKTYLKLIRQIFETTLAQLNKVGDLKAQIGKNGSIVRDILKFYNDVNGTNQKVLFNHKTESALVELENIDTDDLLEKMNKSESLIRQGLDEVASCSFFSGDERRAVEKMYSTFHGWMTETVASLKDKVFNFVNSYEAELHSYGQYCIREDELHGQKSQDDMLTEIVRIALSDGVITPKERMMIETVANRQGITDRAKIDEIIAKMM